VRTLAVSGAREKVEPREALEPNQGHPGMSKTDTGPDDPGRGWNSLSEQEILKRQERFWRRREIGCGR